MGMEYIPTFHGYLDSLASLTDEQFGRVIRAALAYSKYGEMPELDPLETLAFAVVRGDVDRAKAKYDSIAERNRANGMKGGRPPKEQENPKNPVGYLGTQENPKNPEEPKKPIQNKTKQNNTIQNNTNDSVAANAADTPAKEKKPRKTFTPPTVDEVKTYCDECGYGTIDPDAFIDYYAANGWKVGSQAMKDWKATVRNWARRDRERGITSRKPGKEERDPMLEYLDRVINGEA